MTRIDCSRLPPALADDMQRFLAQHPQFSGTTPDEMPMPAARLEHNQLIFQRCPSSLPLSFSLPLSLPDLAERLLQWQQQQRNAHLPVAYSWALHQPQRQLVHPEKEALSLTEKECELLAFFLSHPGQAFTVETLLNDVWGYQKEMQTHTVQTHVYRLRQRLESADAALAACLKHEDGGYFWHS